MTLHSILIQKLLSTNAHLGRRLAAHHFKIYTGGMRNGMTIIDSDKTLICLRNAATFIAHMAREKNARFLFVNTNPLFDEIVEQMTKKIGIYNRRDNIIWKMGGFLTNSYSPKKFKSRKKKVCFAPVQPPDCVVVLDTARKSSVILEADRMQIPIVALVDSSMPWEQYKKIAYPVPANDSVQFVYLFCNIITKTFLLEQKKMKALKGGDIADEERALAKKESGDGVRQIEQSKSESKIRSPIDEVLVVPYQSLAPASNDIAEIWKLLDKLVVVKLSSSLGTALGFGGPKSVIEFRDGLTSLDLLVNQIESLNSEYRCDIPLVLMNTIRTHGDVLKVVEKYSRSNVDIIPFSQGEHLQQKSLSGQISKDELCSCDHPTVFLSLMESGILDVLLSKGKEYIYLLSSDDVAPAIDPKILNHLIQNRIGYCMEVTPTPSYLRNSIVNQHQEKFQLVDITQSPTLYLMEKFKFIDTRNSWVSLKDIKRLADTGALKIQNHLNIQDMNGDSNLLQGTAANLALFDHAIGINVPQSRFVPLNATSDLLLLQSDLYSSVEGVLVRNSARANPANPSISLGSEFEKVNDFQNRFKSIPSIVGLDSLKVVGDVWFGAGITLKGRVTIAAKPGMKLEIPDGVVLEDKEINDLADFLGILSTHFLLRTKN